MAVHTQTVEVVSGLKEELVMSQVAVRAGGCGVERELRLVSSWREVLCLNSLMTAEIATSMLWMASPYSNPLQDLSEESSNQGATFLSGSITTLSSLRGVAGIPGLKRFRHFCS